MSQVRLVGIQRELRQTGVSGCFQVVFRLFSASYLNQIVRCSIIVVLFKGIHSPVDVKHT